MKARKYTKSDEREVNDIFAQYWTDDEFLNELAGELNGETCQFYVVENDDEIVGVAGFREAPLYLSNHADTAKPAELYIIASKYQHKGIGNFLGQAIIEEAKKLAFTELVCYSPETHESSWRFYEKSGFTKHGTIYDPEDGYTGMLWKKTI